MSRGERPDERGGQDRGRQPQPKLPGRHFLAKEAAKPVTCWVGGRTSLEKNGLGNVTADVQVSDVFMSPSRRLKLYLCQLRANNGKPNAPGHQRMPAPLLRTASLLGDPVPVYFPFMLAVALIHLQALNAFPAAQMG